jgi:bifunctional non-homologous end joining protein LigD
MSVSLPEVELATLVDAAPAGDEWLHEIKFDGYRILADMRRGAARLWSRNHTEWTDSFPAVVAAVAALPCARAMIDGEVAAVMPDGRTSFEALHGGGELAYFAFDLLSLDGDDLARLPIEERKARLAKLLAKAPKAVRAIVRFSDHVIGGGPAFFDTACERGLEGIISKRRGTPYTGGRGGDWVKTKCLARQELVIGGFTDPRRGRTGLGALIVGVHDHERLVYAGKVGTGFTAKMLVDLRAKLDRLEVARSPFEPEPRRAWTGPGVHWVKPVLVAEIAFTEWTADGRLRHPSFKGLRADKPAASVVRERARHMR